MTAFTISRTTPQAPQRVVILGARGVIGKALARTCEKEGLPTLCLGREEIDLTREGAGETLAGYLTPDDALVFLSTITPDKGRGNDAFIANVRMAEQVCIALHNVSPAHVIYLSSDTVYPLSEGVIDETTPTQPENLYGAMHLTREYMLRESTTVPLACLRSTLVYSSEDTHNSYGPNRFRRMIAQDGAIRLFGKGEEKRDHIFVEDVAQLIYHTLCFQGTGALNLVTGNSISYADLAAAVAAHYDTQVDIQTTERKNPITHRHFDAACIYKAFPFFRFTPLQEGLARVRREEQKVMTIQ